MVNQTCVRRQYDRNRKSRFKAILNDKFEKEIVAFLNSSRGGELYIGMNDKVKPIEKKTLI